jgi:hypothetical protein
MGDAGEERLHGGWEEAREEGYGVDGHGFCGVGGVFEGEGVEVGRGEDVE